ncbi:MAG: superoxide dismutase family protein [Planctomycetia bacterium]|nr:superoxide dismutase family protein [Planctomycetia bacterium]
MIKTVLSFCTMLSALGLALVARAADEHKHEEVHINEAVAILLPMKASGVNGAILLKQEKGYVQVSGEVSGLKPGKHGFHIHMFGDLRSPDGMSAGGHYNPKGHEHGGPDAKEHHEGDLGNIDANDKGIAKVDVKATGVELHHIVGRSVVVHGDADDLTSQPAGNAGPRIAVGVIGLAEVKTPATAK